jgi:hypothetical protein
MKSVSILRSIKLWAKLETTVNDDELWYRAYKESICAPEPAYWSDKIRAILSANGYGHVWLTGLEPQNQNRFLSSVKQKLKDIEQHKKENVLKITEKVYISVTITILKGL